MPVLQKNVLLRELTIYKTEEGAQVEVQFEVETFWLSLNQIAILFERDKSIISRHFKNIFDSGELQKEVVVAKNATTTQHGAVKGKTQTRQVEYYNLDAILSVGYRVNSKRGTQFRQWATQHLKEHLVKGYTVNQKKLEQLQKTVMFN
ncbi:virulence factor [Sinomicrobium pectinilyticum]|uniref:Virulence factor n=1 Tax=Sinomicrobium pectinilyticum TaxID=1084421 RepID=A0A3N0EG87_SINP1|nr:RhuM family protein [Sinomicrobium pectinilyticum]RNL86699.1 virulence factor [Sinomicrobium pectinilyticum]